MNLHRVHSDPQVLQNLMNPTAQNKIMRLVNAGIIRVTTRRGTDCDGGCGVFESLLVIVACHYYCSFSYNCTVATYKYDKRVDNLVVHY